MPSIAAFPDLLDLSAAAAGQIKFPATQHVSADPNTLDDYKEGTFTPAITFGGGAVGLTYSTRTGTYTKVGRLVFFQAYFLLTAKGSSTGAASISGLPLTANATAGMYHAPAFWFAAMTSISGEIKGFIAPGSTAITPYQMGTGAPSLITNANFTNTTEFIVSGFYVVA